MARGNGRRAGLGAACLLALASCTLLNDLSDYAGDEPLRPDAALEGSPGESGVDAATEAETSTDASADDSSDDAGLDAADAGPTIVELPIANGAFQEVLGFPSDTPASYFTY